MKKLLPLILLIIAFTACQQVEKQNVVVQLLNQGWTLTGDTLDINMQIDVPSVVQQSLYDNGLILHPYLGTVENQLLWISDHPWNYTLHFDASILAVVHQADFHIHPPTDRMIFLGTDVT